MDHSKTPLRLAWAVLLAALLLVAWQQRFIQDDAFISFRYAENLAAGKGLVWNEGERVEGYTNFLWTVLIAAGIRSGMDPVRVSFALGLAAFLATLLATAGLVRQTARSEPTALCVVAILGSNFTFLSYATGGLETQLQAALHAASALLVARALAAERVSAGRLLLLSGLAAAAILNRLDSVLIVGPALGVAALTLRREASFGRRVLGALALGGPVAASVGSWLAWKLRYYGDVLPNTYYAKVSSPTSLGNGLLYLYAFAVSYLLPALLLLLLLALPSVLRRLGLLGALLVGTTGLWCGYVARVGGDFMEFRFMVPILPLLATLLALAVRELARGAAVRGAFVALALFGSLNHALTFMDMNLPYGVYRIESIAHLQGHLTDFGSNWIGVGKALRRQFPDADVVIAVNAAGAVPYYSKLPSLDMRGLTDPWVARHGRITGDRPGHQRMATAAYLVRRRVNLVLAHPELRVSRAAAPSLEGSNFLRFGGPLPASARLLEIPMDEGLGLVCVYLVPSPVVDQAIEAGGWKTWPIR